MDRLLRRIRDYRALTFSNGALKTEHFNTGSGLRSNKSMFPGIRRARKAVGRVGSRRGCVRQDSVASLCAVGRLDLGRLQQQRVHGGERTAACGWEPAAGFRDSGRLPRLRRACRRRWCSPRVKFGDQTVDPAQNADIPYRRRSLQVRFAALTFAQESSVSVSIPAGRRIATGSKPPSASSIIRSFRRGNTRSK